MQSMIMLSKELNMDTSLVLFSESRIPFLAALWYIYMWCQELASDVFCKLQLLINHSMTVIWNNYMGKVCVNALLLWQKQNIGGVIRVFRIDESIFSQRKKKNNVRCICPPLWDFGRLCHTNECFLVAEPD